MKKIEPCVWKLINVVVRSVIIGHVIQSSSDISCTIFAWVWHAHEVRT